MGESFVCMAGCRQTSEPWIRWGAKAAGAVSYVAGFNPYQAPECDTSAAPHKPSGACRPFTVPERHQHMSGSQRRKVLTLQPAAGSQSPTSVLSAQQLFASMLNSSCTCGQRLHFPAGPPLQLTSSQSSTPAPACTSRIQAPSGCLETAVAHDLPCCLQHSQA